MTTSSPLKVLCVGAGNMGRSHALAYHNIPEFEIAGIVTRSAGSREALNEELGGGYACFGDFHEALAKTSPDVVSISTYPDTHAEYAKNIIVGFARIDGVHLEPVGVDALLEQGQHDRVHVLTAAAPQNHDALRTLEELLRPREPRLIQRPALCRLARLFRPSPTR